MAVRRITTGSSDDSRRAGREAVGASFVAGCRLVNYIATGLALLSALAAWLLIEGKTRSRA